MANKARLKLDTTPDVPQSLAGVATAIGRIGELARQRDKRTADMNTALNKVRAAHEERARQPAQEMKDLCDGVKAFCEAHKAAMTEDGKTSLFASGSVCWRTRPPSVSIKKVKNVIVRLQKARLTKFVRTTFAIDKPAMLKEPDLAGEIEGVTIVTGVEDFVITPYGVDLEEVVE